MTRMDELRSLEAVREARSAYDVGRVLEQAHLESKEAGRERARSYQLWLHSSFCLDTKTTHSILDNDLILKPQQLCDLLGHPAPHDGNVDLAHVDFCRERGREFDRAEQLGFFIGEPCVLVDLQASKKREPYRVSVDDTKGREGS
jgi:hypothetical protein